jgi:hypothetical protein
MPIATTRLDQPVREVDLGSRSVPPRRMTSMAAATTKPLPERHATRPGDAREAFGTCQIPHHEDDETVDGQQAMGA